MIFVGINRELCLLLNLEYVHYHIFVMIIILLLHCIAFIIKKKKPLKVIIKELIKQTFRKESQW